MIFRICSKLGVPALALMVAMTASPAFARGWWRSGSTSGGTTSGTTSGSTGGVPEIGTGSAIAALALAFGGAYLLKDRARNRNRKAEE